MIVAVDDPRAEDVQALLAQHLAFAHRVTPAGHVHALDVESLVDPAVTLFSARQDDQLLGVGALRRLDSTHVEIKSMHVRQTERGTGIGLALVRHLLGVAASQGYVRVSLETGAGEVFEPARALYRKVGFRPCPPFAEYTDNPYSVCMTLELRGMDSSGGIRPSA